MWSRIKTYLNQQIPPSQNTSSQVGRGLYIGKYPFPREGKYQPMSFGGKNMKSGREKGGKCKRKRKKAERKWKKGERKSKKGDRKREKRK
jgi:hypothetical protein